MNNTTMYDYNNIEKIIESLFTVKLKNFNIIIC